MNGALKAAWGLVAFVIVVGAVGETSTSACSKAAVKSREMRVRTFWACP